MTTSSFVTTANSLTTALGDGSVTSAKLRDTAESVGLYDAAANLYEALGAKLAGAGYERAQFGPAIRPVARP
jgi:hypothetical protein